MPGNEKKIYLTFDDGPVPDVTPWVLDMLQQYRAQATFFCVGNNVRLHPTIYQRILQEGHSTGNHTMNHMNGWKTGSEEYLSDISKCRKYVSSGLFRPPYGKLSYSQAKKLKKEYRIIMWDVLSRDYDVTLSGHQCLLNVTRKSRPGSIVVFHDSIKAQERLRIALPEVLKYFSENGYVFSAIR